MAMKVSPIPPSLYSISLEETNQEDWFNTITIIALSALLIVAIGLSIHYGLHPTANGVAITSNFSISVPLLAFSLTGVFCAVFLLVQIVRYGQKTESLSQHVAHIIDSSKELQQRLRSILHLWARESGMKDEEVQQDIDKSIKRAEDALLQHAGCFEKAEIVKYKTRDGVQLRGIWCFNDKSHPTVIFFHGTASYAEGRLGKPWFNYYRSKKFNILFVEYRGYGMSKGQAATPEQELYAYWDAKASLDFVFRQKVDEDKILAHGHSLGGSYAAALGYFYDVKTIVLDHTFTHFPALICRLSLILDLNTVICACQSAFPYQVGRKQGYKDLETDLWDTLAKVKKMKGALFVIRGEKDEIMHFEFGDLLIRGRYDSEDLRKKRLATVSGGHDGRIIPIKKFEQFLQEIGLVCA